MADNDRIEFSTSPKRQTSITIGEGAAVVEDGNRTMSMDVEKRSKPKEEEQVENNVDDDVVDDAEGGDAPDKSEDGTDGSEPEPSTDDKVDESGEEGGDEGDNEDVVLPEAFDSKDPENVAAFEKQFTKDGKLNEETLSAEFFKNAESGKKDINEATYDFLESKGIGRELVKTVIADRINAMDAQNASLEAHDNAIFEAAGGPDELKKMIDWGKAGGYTAAQRKRHTDIMNGTDLDAKLEALELLKSRFEKSDAAKPRAPQRDATKGEGRPKTNTLTPFNSRTEWRQARRAADGDLGALKIIDQRAKLSGF